jgi:hypothetical protein
MPLNLFNLSFNSDNNSAPFDFVKEDQIQIFEDKIIININVLCG